MTVDYALHSHFLHIFQYLPLVLFPTNKGGGTKEELKSRGGGPSYRVVMGKALPVPSSSSPATGGTWKGTLLLSLPKRRRSAQLQSFWGERLTEREGQLCRENTLKSRSVCKSMWFSLSFYSVQQGIGLNMRIILLCGTWEWTFLRKNDPKRFPS